ncbi:MAG: hypothetical protein FWG18_03510 [Alphaproteobacteria bacterium]|nr:hypothetical protein [Alphaproteobacteria bacterium]
MSSQSGYKITKKYIWVSKPYFANARWNIDYALSIFDDVFKMYNFSKHHIFAMEVSKDYGFWLYNQMSDKISLQKYLLFCNKNLKDYFDGMRERGLL